MDASRRDDSQDQRISKEEEDRLWERAAAGDEAARETLILAHRPFVFWLARRHFRVDSSRYPDLIQEGMVALITAVDRFDRSKNIRFSTFAFYRVRGRMANFLQRVEARAPLPVDVDDLVLEDETFSSESFEWLLALEAALPKLPKSESEIVEALVLEGKKAREVAGERGVDVSHIYRLQRRALARLRSWLGIDSPQEGEARG
ncbi:sigma-70 family RNA polymerase sigma factor [Aminithiophilus ramosus]|uniref:Sigma-70 family RNA polymerase sigma factor n=2 Tax=Synergistales TaxID=649776 RepID=A0A9Q7EYX0_9BACT|nr:sigma-70 family RNA polymerase sigma factor [Aminithiophilus ramosus]QTX31632.1 sigma-70 family RNA polymerase sigma factor [Aminithiophilus ramosus]QVL35439.1 sigma-70 family RNA polymerase sigma factor [Synergistota bacterium]